MVMRIMNYKKILLLLFVFQLVFELHAQQLPQFSQYVFNGLHVNPGYAGYKNEGYIQTTYRNQWVNFPGSPKTLSVTGDFSFNEGSMGLGVSYVSDKIGLTESNVGLLTFAYRIYTSDRGRLSLGVSGGFSEYVIDPSQMQVVDPNDPDVPMFRTSVFVPNMNTGLFYHTDGFYAGLSAYNMIGQKSRDEGDFEVYYHDFHYYFTMGGLMPLSADVTVKPSVLVKHVQGAPLNMDLNAMFLFKDRFWLGGSFRTNTRLFKDNLQDGLSNRNSVAMILEYFVTPSLRVGYAYDHNLNALSNLKNESHEISIGIYLKSKRDIIYNPRWF
jgi:type IX secretion system PorP/SprF family membrane protein